MERQKKVDVTKVVKDQERYVDLINERLEVTEKELNDRAQKVEQGFKGLTLFKTPTPILEEAADMLRAAAGQIFGFRVEVSELEKKVVKENDQQNSPQVTFGSSPSSAAENYEEVSARGSKS